MKYTPELTLQLVAAYKEGNTPEALSALFTLQEGEEVPTRSIIAKLSSLGVYKKKEYTTKRGETPVKKEEYIERIAKLLDVNAEILESLEKVNKSVLQLIERKLLLVPDTEPVRVEDILRNNIFID
jgi:transcription initiation factor TFIIIB Brf1 subunit/transcription initiation factor TFIIB